jgi:hypothetical protein
MFFAGRRAARIEVTTASTIARAIAHQGRFIALIRCPVPAARCGA